MAKIELKIYNGDYEVEKEFKADRLLWGTLVKAISLRDGLKDKPIEEQFSSISAFVKSIFPGMTDADLAKADFKDVMSTFDQITAFVKDISADKAKNS